MMGDTSVTERQESQSELAEEFEDVPDQLDDSPDDSMQIVQNPNTDMKTSQPEPQIGPSENRPSDEDQLQEDSIRRSGRQRKLTEKGKQYKEDELGGKFYAGYLDLLREIKETSKLLKSPPLDYEDLSFRRTDISARFSSLQGIADALNELSDKVDKDITEHLEDLREHTVVVISGIVAVIAANRETRRENQTAVQSDRCSPAPSIAKSTKTTGSSKRSRSSNTSSKKIAAAAEAAALQQELAAQKRENERQSEIEQIELEEDARRKAAEQRLARLRRELEAERLESKLKAKEAMVRVYEEEENEDSVSISTVRTSSQLAKSDKSKSGIRALKVDHPVQPQDYPPSQGNQPCAGSHLQRSEPQSSSLNPAAPVFNLPSDQRTFDRQNHESLAETLARTVTLNRLPIPEPPVFTGDPLQYPDWVSSFSSLIECRGIPPAERIHYLKRYLGGRAKEAVSGYFLLRSENAFQQAKDVLEQRFGNPFLISEAFRSKLDDWPRIQNKDEKSLQTLSDFLQQCVVAQTEISDLLILNDMREMKKISTKLPEWLTHRWNRTTTRIKKTHGRYPTFQEFSTFVAEEAEIANDPMVTYDVNKSGKDRNPRPSHQTQQGQRKPSTQPHRMTLYTTTQSSPTVKHCLFCKRQNHSLEHCRDFSRKPMEIRRDFVKAERLCFGCYETGHMSKQCTARKVCKVCHKNHPTSLHDETSQQPTSDTKSEKPVARSSSSRDSANKKEATCHKIDASTEGPLTSMVLPVYISSKENPEQEVLVYALLDTMSDTTFVSDSVADELQTTSDDATLRLTTMTNNSAAIPCKKFRHLTVRGFNSAEKISLPATYSRDHIPLNEDHIPTPETASQWPHLTRISHLLVERQVCPVGLLIGYNCARALAPKNCILGGDDEPFAVETELGWSIVGGTEAHSTDNFDAFGQSYLTVNRNVPEGEAPKVNYVCKTEVKEVTAADFLHMMEKDFHENVQDVDKMTATSQDDLKFLQIVKEGIHQRDDGFYEMPLPFRKDEPVLPNNRQAAMHRVMALKKQFTRRPNYKEHYMSFMEEILKRGDAEKVPSEELSTANTWYIPHHGVYHPKKPNKVRVVFDCSARYKGTCLNDHLLQGPDLINPLIGVLCRFREGPIALTCDVEKMYHQFRVAKQHQNFLRFLWWEDGDLDKPPVDFRMRVHIFGATSSPGCANFGLKQIAEDYKDVGPKAAEFLKKNFYVDDGLKGEATVEEATDLIEKAILICRKGNLRLHKVVCNNEEVMKSIPPSERADVAKASLDLDQNSSSIERALGIQWCIKSDCFCFKLTLKDQPLTRRGILATVASIYDPLGLISPLVLVGRQILQKMCESKMHWDDPVPEDLRPKWEEWRQELLKLDQIKIPRCYQPKDFGPVKDVQLHHFSDASLSGYGQCSYVRLTNQEGLVHCSLAMSKARVTPLKSTTIPRLELQAATSSVKIAKVLDAELDYPDLTHHYWTDSKVVLGYIYNETKRFQMYVANRVQRIRETSKPDQWNYVATKENPADHTSRGLTADELTTTNWLTGPAFLWEKQISPQQIDIEIPTDDVEVKKATVHVVNRQRFTPFEERLQRFSSWTKAVTAVTAILTCCLRKKGITLSKIECRMKAEKNLIRIIQRESHSEEITQITRMQTLKNSNPLKSLDPFVDEDNLLRVGGRLKKAAIMYGTKHPVILPKGSQLSRLVARHYHERTAHQGRNLTVNAIRSQGFWIVGIRTLVSSLINKCTSCIRYRGIPKGQKMADLPQERLEPSPPFTYCGLDCFGPYIIKEGRKELKRYGLILTCLAMRAIHIEVLDDMSTDSFLNSLRSFIALRGKVRMIRCDQGSNFIGAKHELKECLKELNADLIASKLLSMECEFKFNTPSSSHMGGIWERQIRNVRNVLNGILDNSGTQLNTSSLRTFMYEAMAIVNSRPLTVENLNNAEGPIPLTPNHVLTMKSGIVMPPPGKFEKADLYLRKRWRRVQYLVNLFWSRWKKEYLHTLQSRKTWTETQKNIDVDDVVILQDEGLCRSDWKLARVVETFPSEDGLVRKVKLLMATSELDKKGKPVHKRSYLERPVHKLVLLMPNSE